MRNFRTLCALIPVLPLFGAGCSANDDGSGPSAGSGGRAVSAGAPGQTGGSVQGGAPSTFGGSPPMGGAKTGGLAGTFTAGGSSNGGSAGAKATAGAPSGGASGGSGGASGGSGGASGGKSSMGGGGSAGKGGSGGGNSGGGGGLLPGNAPVLSAGCGKDTTVTNGKKTIMSSNESRSYIIDIPSNYDKNKPYRLFYTSHWIGSTSEAVQGQNYYFLKPLATAANQPAIFVAPQSQGSTWQEKDHALFDDILAYVKQNLCIDTTRVFATGFSFGGMITYSLSVNHQKDIRAGVGIAPANYNIYVPPNKSHEPIAWMQTTGMKDGTCPWINGNSTTQGAKFIAIEHATDNGCTVPANIPTWQQGAHVCYDFEGCKAGFPTKVCTFNGDHTNINSDPGSNANWIPEESWKFFTQF